MHGVAVYFIVNKTAIRIENINLFDVLAYA